MQDAQIDLRCPKYKRLDSLLIPSDEVLYISTMPKIVEDGIDPLNILHIIHFIMMT